MTQLLPQFLSDVGCERSQQAQQGFQFFPCWRILPAFQSIQIFHQGSDGRVVFQGRYIFCDPLDDEVHGSLRLSRRPLHWRMRPQTLDQPPYSIQKTYHTTDAAITEIAASFVWPHKHQVDPEDVHTKMLDVGIGIDDIAPGLGDLCPVLCNGAVGAETLERL